MCVLKNIFRVVSVVLFLFQCSIISFKILHYYCIMTRVVSSPSGINYFLGLRTFFEVHSIVPYPDASFMGKSIERATEKCHVYNYSVTH